MLSKPFIAPVAVCLLYSVLNFWQKVTLIGNRAERTSCARHITLDWIGLLPNLKLRRCKRFLVLWWDIQQWVQTTRYRRSVMMISNGWRMPSSAGLNRLQETNSQWEGIPIGNGLRKKLIFENTSTNWQWHKFFSLEALVCRDEMGLVKCGIVECGK